MAKPHYTEALRQSGVLGTLALYDPHVAGTPPLGIDRPASDLDILCYVPDPMLFAAAVWNAFSDYEDFSMRQWAGPDRPIITEFTAAGWQIEVFGQARPVREQHGWRHFLVEQRLLALGSPAFRDAVMQRREGGAKTEPAFADVLGLAGNPYQVLLQLEQRPDAVLATLLARQGF
jgi:hypothetical protein